MKLSLEEIKKASDDVRIELTAAEEKDLLVAAQNLWEQISILKSEKLASAENTSVPIQQQNTLRDDLLKPSLPQHAVLKNAPDVKESYFHVPRIIEE